MKMRDTTNLLQEFPFERHGISRPPGMGPRTPVVYRYKTAEDRENHLVEERRVLEALR